MITLKLKRTWRTEPPSWDPILTSYSCEVASSLDQCLSWARSQQCFHSLDVTPSILTPLSPTRVPDITSDSLSSSNLLGHSISCFPRPSTRWATPFKEVRTPSVDQRTNIHTRWHFRVREWRFVHRVFAVRVVGFIEKGRETCREVLWCESWGSRRGRVVTKEGGRIGRRKVPSCEVRFGVEEGRIHDDGSIGGGIGASRHLCRAQPISIRFVTVLTGWNYWVLAESRVVAGKRRETSSERSQGGRDRVIEIGEELGSG